MRPSKPQLQLFLSFQKVLNKMYTQLETEVIVIRRDIVKILLKMQELHKFLKIYLLCLR